MCLPQLPSGGTIGRYDIPERASIIVPKGTDSVLEDSVMPRTMLFPLSDKTDSLCNTDRLHKLEDSQGRHMPTPSVHGHNAWHLSADMTSGGPPERVESVHLDTDMPNAGLTGATMYADDGALKGIGLPSTGERETDVRNGECASEADDGMADESWQDWFEQFIESTPSSTCS
ncbi:hypothetical protein IAU60_001889 [Kwoniella sp. DSM 27419]